MPTQIPLLPGIRPWLTVSATAAFSGMAMALMFAPAQISMPSFWSPAPGHNRYSKHHFRCAQLRPKIFLSKHLCLSKSAVSETVLINDLMIYSPRSQQRGKNSAQTGQQNS
jgi:hypothetical protein